MGITQSYLPDQNKAINDIKRTDSYDSAQVDNTRSLGAKISIGFSSQNFVRAHGGLFFAVPESLWFSLLHTDPNDVISKVNIMPNTYRFKLIDGLAIVTNISKEELEEISRLYKITLPSICTNDESVVLQVISFTPYAVDDNPENTTPQSRTHYAQINHQHNEAGPPADKINVAPAVTDTLTESESASVSGSESESESKSDSYDEESSTSPILEGESESASSFDNSDASEDSSNGRTHSATEVTKEHHNQSNSWWCWLNERFERKPKQPPVEEYVEESSSSETSRKQSSNSVAEYDEDPLNPNSATLKDGLDEISSGSDQTDQEDGIDSSKFDSAASSSCSPQPRTLGENITNESGRSELDSEAPNESTQNPPASVILRRRLRESLNSDCNEYKDKCDNDILRSLLKLPPSTEIAVDYGIDQGDATEDRDNVNLIASRTAFVNDTPVKMSVKTSNIVSKDVKFSSKSRKPGRPEFADENQDKKNLPEQWSNFVMTSSSEELESPSLHDKDNLLNTRARKCINNQRSVRTNNDRSTPIRPRISRRTMVDPAVTASTPITEKARSTRITRSRC